MALTHDEAVAQWKTDNPMPVYVSENGEQREVTPEEYEAMAQDRAALLVDQSARQEEVVAQKVEGRGIVAKGKALDTTADRLDSAEAFTPVQLRHFMAEHQRVTAQMIRFLTKKFGMDEEE